MWTFSLMHFSCRFICLPFIANARFQYSIWFFGSLVLYQVFRWRNGSKHTPYYLFPYKSTHTHKYNIWNIFIAGINLMDTRILKLHKYINGWNICILWGNIKQKTISSKNGNIKIFLGKYYATCIVTWYCLHSGYYRILLLYFSSSFYLCSISDIFLI